jgi:hypothetical protein
MKNIFLLICFTLVSLSTIAQHTLKGTIVDNETGSPLPFVNIVYNERGQGLTTGLDGHFEIVTSEHILWLKLSYVGYKPQTVIVNIDKYNQPQIIGLAPLAYSIDEVVVRPGINPAHRIINEVYRNRDANNPEKLDRFRYNSYNKIHFTFDRDSAVKKSSRTDSLQLRIERFKKRQHIFLMESVTERNFMQPNNNSEHILASRVSGYKDPIFVFISTLFQSFSFYPEIISLAGKHYLNPISKGSTSRYLFILEDTIYTQSYDTVFVISFRPLRNKNFAALQGSMNINSNGYAIQSVIAEPVEVPSQMFNVKIQQRYALIDSTQWFPIELNTDIYIRMANRQSKDNVTGQPIPLSIVGVGNSYIKNIELNPKIRSRDFSHVELTFDPLSGERDEEFWTQFRNENLSKQDLRTYTMIDSLGKAAKLDQKLRLFESLATGRLPIGIFNIDLNRIINYNRFEGYRLGIGLETNQKVSRWFTLGGYYAHGFTDREDKFGGFGKVTLNQRHQISLEGSYEHDVREPGEFMFQKPFGLFNSDQFRNVLIWRMDYVDKYSAQLNFRVFKNFSVSLIGNQSQFNISSGYEYNHPNLSSSTNFTTNEVGTEIRFVWKETFMETPRGLLPLGFGYPMIWLKYYKGLPYFGSHLSYNRVEARFDYQVNHRTIGRTSITISSGLIDGDVPTSLLYYGIGSNDKYPLDATHSFATMGLYSYVSNKFAYVFVRHNFGRIFPKTKSRIFKPQFAVVQNFGIGNYSHKSTHIFPGIQPQTISKGYFESGILINGILSNPLYSLGLGSYYRWGPYADADWKSNYAFKLTLAMNF